MKTTVDATSFSRATSSSKLDGKLASYLAASSIVGTFLATEAHAVVVSNTSVQPFGINGAVNIDFNHDGQVDYQIDHDRVDLGGGNNVDYLQLDKNDVNGASPGESPFPINVFATFPLNGNSPNNTATAAYVTPTATQGDYPAALTFGTPIGPTSHFDFQETDNFNSLGQTIRANRLIDEDHTQVDTVLGGLTAAQVATPTNGPNFVGLGGAVRYLGVKMDLQSTGLTTYGWIGIQITNEADATGNVVGWGYQTSGAPIAAGAPEPTSIMLGAIGGAFLGGGFLVRKLLTFFKR
jgi:hypothetical protein